MAYMFEVKNSNSTMDGMQNIAGKFGTYSDGTYTAQDCNAGFLCTKAALIPCEGYEAYNVVNGDTWYFTTAATGTVTGQPGDRTGIFAFNSYDVNKASSGDNRWNLGANTLGLKLPAGERGDFTELKVGDNYAWGGDNFSATPDLSDGEIYVTVVNGEWVADNAAPTTGEIYGIITKTDAITEGASTPGTRYWIEIHRSVAAAEAVETPGTV